MHRVFELRIGCELMIFVLFFGGQDSATFESALDWLCFNLPGDELPLKFSSGGTSSTSSRAGMKFEGFMVQCFQAVNTEQYSMCRHTFLCAWACALISLRACS